MTTQKNKPIQIKKSTAKVSVKSKQLLVQQRETTQKITLPGYYRFTREVLSFMRVNKILFLRLALLSWLVAFLVSGTTEQAQYNNLVDSTKAVTEQIVTGAGRSILEICASYVAVVSGGLASTLSEGQRLYMGGLYLMLWLVTVWLLRHRLAGTSVKLRDGLYNAGAPVLTTLLIVAVGIVQLLPLAIGVSLLGSAIAAGGIVNAFGIALSIIVMILLLVATLYWLSGTLFAAIIVTIPGTYPRAALRSAAELIKGRRLVILLRMMWLVMVCFVAFSIFVIPFLIIDHLFGLTTIALGAIIAQLISIVLGVFAATYSYMLYRRVIDERN